MEGNSMPLQEPMNKAREAQHWIKNGSTPFQVAKVLGYASVNAMYDDIDRMNAMDGQTVQRYVPDESIRGHGFQIRHDKAHDDFQDRIKISKIGQDGYLSINQKDLGKLISLLHCMQLIMPQPWDDDDDDED